MRLRYVAFGLVFGFILSRVGATSYDAIAGMFRLTDLHLMGVIGTAVVLNAAVFAVIRGLRVRARTGEPIALEPKPMTKGLVTGAALFGVGWALSGTCPGTALAQIGEAQLSAFATVGGILLGAYLHGRKRGAPSTAPNAEGARLPAPKKFAT